MIEFDVPRDILAIRDSVRSFVDGELLPIESQWQSAPPAPEVVASLRTKALAAGIYGPHLPTRYGGLGLNWRGTAVIFEAAGRSLLGPIALNGAAPDEANMHLLARAASPEQAVRYLEPLARGKTRSCFAMTEPPPGAGSDPSMLLTRACRTDRGWIIDGTKSFISGANGASFAICVARTSDIVDPHHGATMFLVDANNPGMNVERQLDTLDHLTVGGHCVVTFEKCEVGHEAVLGEVDKGFSYVQLRLAPARLTHCMRWLGVATRAQEIAIRYASERSAFGRPLSKHQGVSFPIADMEIEIHAARLMVWHAAWLLDRGQPARHETSIAKTFVAETVFRVIDQALQICGSLGVSNDIPLSTFLSESRPFRIYDGPSEVHRMAIASRLFRLYGAPAS